LSRRAAIVAIEPQHRARAGREADEQIGIAVAVEVPPRRGARRARIADAGGAGNVREDALVVSIQPVWRAVEADEEIEIAVAVVIGGGVHQGGPGAEHLPRGGAEGAPAA